MNFVLTKENSARGFTFIELMCVVIIIGILAAVSFPQISKYSYDLELDIFSRDLQTVINYLCQRAVVDRSVICLTIDDENKRYWAFDKDGRNILKTYPIPPRITVAAEQKQIMFYPDGSVDKFTVRLINRQNRCANLTSKGIFCGAKLEF